MYVSQGQDDFSSAPGLPAVASEKPLCPCSLSCYMNVLSFLAQQAGGELSICYAGTASSEPKAGIFTLFLVHSSAVTKEKDFQCLLDFISKASIR